MPFTKRGRYYYTPHGRGKRYTARQVRAYYATHGFTRKPRTMWRKARKRNA